MNKKKLTSLSLALAVAASLFSSVGVQAEQYYSDVAEGHWAYEWVTYMNEKGYIHGYPDGTYLPDQYITRAEYVTILNYIFDSEGTTDKNYIDVIEGDWYYDYIHAAVANGYLHGYNDATDEHDGTMKPNNYITREEAAVVVADAYGLALNSDVSKFGDAENISDWAVPYVGALAGGEVLMGDEDHNFRPKDNMKRAEVASMLAQAEIKKDDLVYEEVVTLPDEIVEADGVYSIEGITTKHIPAEKNFIVAVEISEEGEVGTYKMSAAINDVAFADKLTKEALIEMLAAKNLTVEELEGLSISVSDADKAKDGAKITIVVKIVDSADAEKVYAEKEYVIEFDGTVTPGGDRPTPGGSGGSITGGGSKVTPVDDSRDRVVESLTDYQNDLTNASSSRKIANDTRNHGISNDMIKVIVTNDGMVTFDDSAVQTKDSKNVDSALPGLGLENNDALDIDDYYDDLYLVYEDVIKYVLDNKADYKSATIDTATKEKYVLLFRAMVETINGAADAAVKVYNDPANSGKTADDKFNLFKIEAGNNTTAALNDNLSTLDATEKAAIVDLAVAYVTDLFNANNANRGEIRDALAAAGTLDVEVLAEIIKDYI